MEQQTTTISSRSVEYRSGGARHCDEGSLFLTSEGNFLSEGDLSFLLGDWTTEFYRNYKWKRNVDLVHLRMDDWDFAVS